MKRTISSFGINQLLLLVALGTLGGPGVRAADPAVSLAGPWRFQLDRADVGITEHWFAKTLPDQVRLPGTLTEQGIGDDIATNTPWIAGLLNRAWFTAPEYEKYRQPGNSKVPFFLQPEKYYAGAAWYQRDLEIPAAW